MEKQIKVNNTLIQLLPKRAVFLPTYKTLVISDWHLNKLEDNTPYESTEDDFVKEELQNLEQLVQEYQATRLVLLGGMFHPDWKEDWSFFYDFARYHKELEIVSIQKRKVVPENKALVPENFEHREEFHLNNKIFFVPNDVKSTVKTSVYFIGGYLPGCIVSGNGGQVYRMACFKVDGNKIVMPSFGAWTQLNIIEKEKNTFFYPILGDHIVSIK